MEVNASEIFTHWFSAGDGWGGWNGKSKSLTTCVELSGEMILFRKPKYAEDAHV